MDYPLFEICFEKGPLDGLTLTTNILPDDELTLPARPDRVINIGNGRQTIEGPLAHYELTFGGLKPGNEIPVVQFRFRFRRMSQREDFPLPAGRRLNWFRRLWARFQGSAFVDNRR